MVQPPGKSYSDRKESALTNYLFFFFMQVEIEMEIEEIP